MKFDIPVVYDNEYIEFINSNQENIHSVYFSMPVGRVSDARILSNEINIVNFNIFLNHIPRHIKKYVTLNGRYTPIDLYSNNNIQNTILNLKILYESGNLSGLIFVDFYYILLLSRIDPEFINQLELIPSINCYIDSIEKFHTYMKYISPLSITRPSKIILDRSLNRNIKKLESIVVGIKSYDPDLKIEILANEGCMYQCPFKINHDICISLVNDRSVGGIIYLNGKLTNNDFDFQNINQNYGCLNYLTYNPVDILKSPFIRPEDISKYPFVDIIKLSGKVRPFNYLQKSFTAYNSGKYDKNLLDLLDSVSIFNEKYYMFNDQFPKDFFERTTSCNKNCQSCKYCDKVFEKVIQYLK